MNEPEKFLVPGDFVYHPIAYETNVWLGKPVRKQHPSIVTHIESEETQKKPVQFGHEETIHKISKALGSLMEKEMSKVVPNKELLNPQLYNVKVRQ